MYDCERIGGNIFTKDGDYGAIFKTVGRTDN